MKLKVTVNGIPYHIEVEVEEEEKAAPSIVIGGAGGMQTPIASTASVSGDSANAVTAPLSGTVSKLLVEEAQEISEGQVLVVLEAMKMETEITAPRAGTISAIHVAQGDAVQGGQPLFELAD